MAKFKNIILTAHQGQIKITVPVSIDVQGDFYCKIPAELLVMFSDFSNIPKGVQRGCDDKLFAKVFTDLEDCLKRAVYHCFQPVITKEKVIRYSITNTFPYTIVDGVTVAPNGYYGERDADYEHFGSPTRLGGLSIVAKAEIKTTAVRGEKVDISYDNYYGEDGSHLGTKNPAERLNSWGRCGLCDSPKEIPYSDEAAVFFFDAMMGMARLAHMIRTSTDSPEKIRTLITGKQGLLGLPKSGG